MFYHGEKKNLTEGTASGYTRRHDALSNVNDASRYGDHRIDDGYHLGH